MDKSLTVRLFRPSKHALQAGKAKTRQWVLEVQPAGTCLFKDPLMGWTGSRSTLDQVVLRFETLEEAQRYAETKGWVILIEPEGPQKKPSPQSYARNFHPDRRW